MRQPKTFLAVSAFIALTGSVPALAVDLRANFNLYGEVLRFGLGQGSVPLHFGVDSGLVAPQIGNFGYQPGGIPFASGVLSALVLPPSDVPGVVDYSFSLPFSMDVNAPSSMYIGIGDNGINGISGGNIQVYFDFSDNTFFPGWSILGATPDQGLKLNSVTLADGTSLDEAGFALDFILENTILTAGASAINRCGFGVITTSVFANVSDVAFFGPAGCNTAAASKLQGGADGFNPATEALVDLDVLGEPDPFSFDFAFATVSGRNNVILREVSLPPSTPSVPGPLPLFGAAAAFSYSRKIRKRIKSSALLAT